MEIIASESGETNSFEMPKEVEAGLTRIDFVNNGAEPHHVQLFKLNEGVTIEEVKARLESNEPAALLELGGYEGGTGLVAPSEESQADAVVDLTPGTYAVICFVPGPDGTPHYARGMFRPLEVNESSTRSAILEATHQVSLVDYRFDVPQVLPGDALLKVTNISTMEPHEMTVAKPTKNADIEKILVAIERGKPIPAVPLGGIQGILPGKSQYLQLDLEPGEYIIWCQIPSPDGTPHVMQGMIQRVEVR